MTTITIQAAIVDIYDKIVMKQEQQPQQPQQPQQHYEIRDPHGMIDIIKSFGRSRL